MDDSEALLWDKSRRKRDLEDHEKLDGDQTVRKRLATDINEDGNDSTSNKVIHQGTKLEEESGLSDKVPDRETEESILINKAKVQESVDNESSFSNEEIHAKLKSIDPIMAKRLHPNNRRKVLR